MKPFALLPFFLALTCFLAGCAVGDKTLAEKAVEDFHAQFNKSDFAGIYSAAHPKFQATNTEKDFVAMLDAVHNKLGAVQSSVSAGWKVSHPEMGTEVVLNYNTKFTNGDAIEVFNYRIDKDKAFLRSYNINLPALITK